MAPPLTPASILDGMAAALPTHAKDDATSDLSSSLDAVALFTHACFVSVGFRLLGFSEDKPEESECQSLAPRLPSTWNRSLSSHCFVYAHEQSSMRFVIRVDRMGSKIEIRGLGVGDERIARFDITTRDYVSAAALPIRITITEDGQGEEDRNDLPEKLKKAFISEERITDLASLLKINIIQRLVPGLQKEGYQEDPDDRAARQDADEAGRRAGGSRNPPAPPMMPNPMPDPAQPYPYPHDLDPPARRPIPAGDFPPPDFEDEYEINRHPRASGLPGLVGGPPNPGLGGRSDYGRSDLYPAGLGPDDPIRGSFVPPLGGLPRPGGRGPGGFGSGGLGGTGGMHPTFDDPLFQGPRGGDEGDGGYDDQAPPGARWDPVGPGGAPRFGGNRPGGNGRGGRGFGGGGFGGGGFGGFGDII
ncbi:PI31 proteasome regulator N-terminal-domain-containing protein [Pseudoneurospora amorphoporcata]|uniref:PI31 proteasome regulator N-terminal-domain-containing protein n=1 Tax=Pseudoneurospora amorphoporcata TaxID=241081 RepID=A0AAN6SD00_9PEZI|nr:PI31 proteasome regulator N-terminal-domain-containing protein [Pseudoneurospora amorphoporcata]